MSIYAVSGFEMVFEHTDSGLKHLEAVMNPHTFTRLLWQLPVLTWLVVLLMPGISWHTTLFGPWPLWLLASPVLLLLIGRRRVAAANPPCHAGTAVDFTVARAMFRQAMGALVSGGRLLVVANRQLPYEADLAALGKFETLSQNGGFKLLAVRRP